jgi:hypothetical protein
MSHVFCGGSKIAKKKKNSKILEITLHSSTLSLIQHFHFPLKSDISQEHLDEEDMTFI